MSNRMSCYILSLTLIVLCSVACGLSAATDERATDEAVAQATALTAEAPTATPTPTTTPTSTPTSTPVPPTATSTPTPPTATLPTPLTVEDVPEIENLLVQRILEEGVGERFVIEELVVAPGVAEGGVTFSEGDGGTIQVTTEFPGDILPLGGFVFDVRVWRFRGSVPTEDEYIFVGEGDTLNLLTFARIADVGFVYLRGKGKVIFPNEQEVKLGYED